MTKIAQFFEAAQALEHPQLATARETAIDILHFSFRHAT